jgi:hypothetical protein
VFAGYWRPTVGTRIWVALFFLLVRLQRVFGFAPRMTLRPADAEPTKQSSS